MRVITTWSYVDLALINLVSAFLHADFHVVNEMFLALSGSAQRRKLMDGAALVLSEPDHQLYERVMERIRVTEAHRNTFAHWIWTFASSMPDALLLIDPNGLSRHQTASAVSYKELREWVRWINTHGGKDADWTIEPPAPAIESSTKEIDRELIMVYRENDLRRELADVQRAQLLVEALQDAFALADSEYRAMVETILQGGELPTA